MDTGNLTESDFNAWVHEYVNQVLEEVLKDYPEIAKIMESTLPSLTQNPTI